MLNPVGTGSNANAFVPPTNKRSPKLAAGEILEIDPRGQRERAQSVEFICIAPVDKRSTTGGKQTESTCGEAPWRVGHPRSAASKQTRSGRRRSGIECGRIGDIGLIEL